MDPKVMRSQLQVLAKAIFHIIAKVPELKKAEEKIVELLESLFDRALQLQTRAVVDAIVETLKHYDLPTCECGKRYIDRSAFVDALKKVAAIKGSSAPSVN